MQKVRHPSFLANGAAFLQISQKLEDQVSKLSAGVKPKFHVLTQVSRENTGTRVTYNIAHVKLALILQA